MPEPLQQQLGVGVTEGTGGSAGALLEGGALAVQQAVLKHQAGC